MSFASAFNRINQGYREREQEYTGMREANMRAFREFTQLFPDANPADYASFRQGLANGNPWLERQLPGDDVIKSLVQRQQQKRKLEEEDRAWQKLQRNQATVKTFNDALAEAATKAPDEASAFAMAQGLVAPELREQFVKWGQSQPVGSLVQRAAQERAMRDIQTLAALGADNAEAYRQSIISTGGDPNSLAAKMAMNMVQVRDRKRAEEKASAFRTSVLSNPQITNLLASGSDEATAAARQLIEQLAAVQGLKAPPEMVDEMIAPFSQVAFINKSEELTKKHQQFYNTFAEQFDSLAKITRDTMVKSAGQFFETRSNLNTSEKERLAGYTQALSQELYIEPDRLISFLDRNQENLSRWAKDSQGMAEFRLQMAKEFRPYSTERQKYASSRTAELGIPNGLRPASEVNRDLSTNTSQIAQMTSGIMALIEAGEASPQDIAPDIMGIKEAIRATKAKIAQYKAQMSVYPDKENLRLALSTAERTLREQETMADQMAAMIAPQAPAAQPSALPQVAPQAAPQIAPPTAPMENPLSQPGYKAIPDMVAPQRGEQGAIRELRRLAQEGQLNRATLAEVARLYGVDPAKVYMDAFGQRVETLK